MISKKKRLLNSATAAFIIYTNGNHHTIMYLRIFGLLLLLFSLCAVAAAEPLKIIISQTAQRDSTTELATRYLKKLITERSDSRLQVTIRQDQGQSSAAVLQQLADRKIQFALLNLVELKQQLPGLAILELPFLFPDRDQLYRTLLHGSGQRIYRMAQSAEFKLLGFWDSGFHQLAAAAPLLTPAAADDVLLLPTDSLLRAGLQKSNKPGLQKTEKNIGYDLPLEQLLRQPADSASYLTLSNHRVTGYLLVTDRSFWNRLPEDLKVIISGTLQDATGYARELSQQAERKNLTKLITDRSMIVQRLSLTQQLAWQAESKKIYSQLVPDIDQQIIKSILAEQHREMTATGLKLFLDVATVATLEVIH